MRGKMTLVATVNGTEYKGAKGVEEALNISNEFERRELNSLLKHIREVSLGGLFWKDRPKKLQIRIWSEDRKPDNHVFPWTGFFEVTAENWRSGFLLEYQFTAWAPPALIEQSVFRKEVVK